jgi:hypothetical protein
VNLPADFQRVLPILLVAVVGLGAAVLVVRGLGGADDATKAQQVLDRAEKEEPKSAALEMRIGFSIASPPQGVGGTVVETRVAGEGADTAPGKPSRERLHFDEQLAGNGAASYDELSTGTQGFIRVDGRWYRLDDAQFQRVFKSDVKSPDFEPLRWMINPRSEGTIQVDGVAANHIRGDANINAMLTELGVFKGSEEGTAAGRAVVEAMKTAPKRGKMDVLVGKKDGIVRKLTATGQLDTAAGSVPLHMTVSFAFAASKVNQPVSVQAPKTALPPSQIARIPRAKLGSQADDILGASTGTTGRGPHGKRRGSAQSYVSCVEAAADLGALERCQRLLPSR